MMRIDTSHLSGWEDRVVVLEFEHDPATYSPRGTMALLTEFAPPRDHPAPPTGGGWWNVPSGGWKRTLTSAQAWCSLRDQFCRETGRRVALRRLAASGPNPQPYTYPELRKAAIRQYFEDRARRRRGA